MAATATASSISLHGVPEGSADQNHGPTSAILFKLDESMVQDLRKASRTQDSLHFTTGNTPKLRIGTRTIDLSISADDFRNELFASTTGASSTDFTFTTLIGHRAQPKATAPNTSHDRLGPDAALAALTSTLASYAQEKQANSTTITDFVLPTPKNRFDAARKERLEKKRPLMGASSASRPMSPSLSATTTPRLGPTPTSAPGNEDTVRMQAMKKPLIHLLAIGPATSEEIAAKTHIPQDDLDNLLQKAGRSVDGKRQLSDRAFKDLDVWKFEYESKEDRKAAVDNAIKAFDRLRLGKDDQLWQMLLPQKDRGKGIVLSRLHHSMGGGQMPPTHLQTSPMPHADGIGDGKLPSGANTPKPGSSTPRPGSAKGDIMKRLFSKNPKKARAAEDAKVRKRKEREEATSDREGSRPAKKQATTKKTNPNVKSAEVVHSSDEEEIEAEIAVEKAKATAVAKVKPKPKLESTRSSDSSDIPLKEKKAATANPLGRAKPNGIANQKATAAASSPTIRPSTSSMATTGKRTPQTTGASNGLVAPSSQHSSQRSPQLPNGKSRPSVPSPLGPARPRVTSDVSDRGAVGVQKGKPGGVSGEGAEKRRVGEVKKADPSEKQPHQRKAVGDGKPMSRPSDVTKKNPSDLHAKRKAQEVPSRSQPSPVAKHRKCDSASSHSHSHSQPNSASQPPKPPRQSSSSSPENDNEDTTSSTGSNDNASASSLLENISFEQGVTLGRALEVNYNRYAELYDRLAALEARGEKVDEKDKQTLLRMHEAILERKREIRIAAGRERG